MEFKTIGEILGQKYYAIPDYQRDYEWTNAENQTLLDDIIALLLSGDERHFFGAIVTVPFDSETGTTKVVDFSEYSINENNVRHLVDGQQRLTSFSILCCALKDIIDEDSSIDAEDKTNYFLNKLGSILYGDKFKNKKPAPRLVLNGDSGKCFNNKILKVTSDNPNMIYKGPKRLIQAYKLYYEGIKSAREESIKDKEVKNSEEFYVNLLDTITERIIFVDIKCDGAANAFQVFDSLNGKGLDLTAADRIKNIFISWKSNGKGAQKWNSFVEKVGEDYLVNFFISEFFFINEKRVPKNNLPNEFKNSYKDLAKKDFDSFTSRIETDGEYYGQLRKANTGDDELNKLLKDFGSIGQDQAYVLLFAAYKQFHDNGMKKSEYFEFARELFSLAVRMQVCEKSTNRLDAIFSNAIKKMKSGTSSLPLLTQYIKDEKVKNICDKEFEDAFVRFAPKDNRVSEVYVRYIENYYRKTNGDIKDRTPVESGLTVEHIIPEACDLTVWYGGEAIPIEVEVNFKDEYIQSIGNKMLLYGDDNSSANNNDYSYKTNVYKNGKRGQNQGTPEGTFAMVKDLLKTYPSKFNHQEVMSRAKTLAGVAKNLW